MSKNWSQTTATVVPPFVRLDDCLRDVKFRLDNESDFESKDTLKSDDIDPAKLAPEILLAIDYDAEALRAQQKDLAVMVRLQDRRMHRSEIVLERPLAKAPETFAIPDDVRRRFAWNFGVDVVITLIQSSDRAKAVAGRPNLRGHWVARKVFSVAPSRGGHTFPIEPWTPEQFEHEGLPADTLYWLKLNLPLNQVFENVSDVGRLGVRKDVFEAITDDEKSPAAVAFENMVAVEAVADALFTGLNGMAKGEELEPGGFLESLVERFTKEFGFELSDLLQMAENRADGHARIRAYAQSLLGVSKRLAKNRRRSNP